MHSHAAWLVSAKMGHLSTRDPHFKDPFSVYTHEMYKGDVNYSAYVYYMLTSLSIFNLSFCKQFAAWSSRFCVLMFRSRLKDHPCGIQGAPSRLNFLDLRNISEHVTLFAEIVKYARATSGSSKVNRYYKTHPYPPHGRNNLHTAVRTSHIQTADILEIKSNEIIFITSLVYKLSLMCYQKRTRSMETTRYLNKWNNFKRAMWLKT